MPQYFVDYFGHRNYNDYIIIESEKLFMKKSEKIFSTVGLIFLILGLIVIICELFSVSIFLFGKRLIYIIGIFLIISVVSFTLLAFCIFKNHSSHFKSKKIIIALKAVIVAVCLFVCAAGFIIDGMLYTKTIYKNVSADKRHIIIVEGLPELYEWNVTVYKRNTSLFLVKRDSKVLNDMAYADEEISVEWVEGGCKMSYEIFSDDATSPNDTEVSVQSFFFIERT